MSRFALFAIFCLTLLSGCGGTPSSFKTVDHVEYRWGDSDSVPYRPLPSLLREPPDRNEALVLHIRFVVPKLEDDDPAILVGDEQLDHGTVDGRIVKTVGRAPTILPLDPGDSGKTLDLVFRGRHRIDLGELYVGSERDVFTYAFGGDLTEFAVGATLALCGIFLLGAAFARRKILEYAWMGVFTLAIGVMAVGQATVLAMLILPSPLLWVWLIALGRTIFPIGLLQFVIQMFGDTRRRLLQVLSYVFGALAVVQLALYSHPYIGTNPIARVTPALIVIGAVTVFIVVWRRRHDVSARIFLWGFGALFLITLPDLSWSAGYPIFFFNMTPFGILGFAAAMILVVERSYREKAAALEKSSADLSHRVNEIELLNDELRHQVETRSRELRAALTGSLPQLEGPSKDLATGDVVGDRYRIVRRIGEGAMGAVYEAERRTDQKRFALKVMTGAITSTDAARFAREAEMAAHLRHENLVAILDVGVHASREPYLVLELVVGRALDEASDRFGDVTWALPILHDIAAGLAALHHLGIVHRDLKPANVLLEKAQNGAEKAKIADFGIAREGDDVAPVSAGARTLKSDTSPSKKDPKITQTGALIGTPLYMAPESAQQVGVTRAADIFAFSLLAYEILTKTRPFDPPAVLQALAGQTIPRVTIPTTLRLDRELASAIEHGLAADPGERPSAAELERILATVMKASTKTSSY